MELDITRPITDVFQHTHAYFRDRFPQLPPYGEWSRTRAVEAIAWLESELGSRRFIAGDRYSMADIVAQCSFVLGKAVAIRIPPEAVNLTRWFAEVASRPTARA
jgi:glutathione S-transferase